jgi:hypothetical protein
MTFKKAVTSVPELTNSFCDGLQALLPKDAARMTPSDPRKIAGSVDLDHSLVKFSGKRWDYAVGYERSAKSYCIYWIEIHPGNSGEIAEVIGKLESLMSWLKNAGAALDTRPRRFVWISSGKTSLTLSAPQQKKFTKLGLEHCGRHLRLS